jgi:L-ascorbate metabolism protein UlaG (beta-lactamase superfamily)
VRITRYPQSCLVVEVDGSRLLIDPGTLVSARYAVDDVGDVDAVLFTHRHADHLDPGWARELHDREVALFGNADVIEALGGSDPSVPSGAVTEVHAGERFTAAGVEVAPYDLPHVPMVDGSPGPPNTGFVVDGSLFHPGDGVEITGLTVPTVAAPICGPSISFRDAYRLVESVGADRVVPIHYQVFKADPEHFARVCDLAEVVVLDDGETAELS